MTHLWSLPNWPAFNWSNSELMDLLVSARFEQGRLLSLPSEFVHSFEVSDIKKHIYADLQFAREKFDLEKLNGWQASLFPTGYSGTKKIKIAEFRTKDLQGRTSLPYQNLPEEIEKYLHWWHEPPVGLDPVLRSAIAFFWFLLISPYEDGNFELACSLTELSLQQNEKTTARCYDISLQLEENKFAINEVIEKMAISSGDITDWLKFFLEQYIVATRAAFIIADKNQNINFFWKKFSKLNLNVRQRTILNIMLEEERHMTNRDYVALCKTSRESAKRDLMSLVKEGILKLGEKRGRSVSYALAY